MNVFGFFATIIICGTIIGALWILSKFPISIKIIRTTEAPKIITPKVEATEEVKKDASAQTVTTEPEQKIIAMDAVIREANALMGIETIEGDK